MHASQAGEGDDFLTVLLLSVARAAASALHAVTADRVAVAVIIAETLL
jgi:hypothetical protein